MRTLCCLLLWLAVGPAGFTQSCTALDFGFEGYTTASPPPDWTLNGSYISGGSAHAGSRKAGLNSKNDELITPVLDCAEQVCYYWRASSATAKFTVQVHWKDSVTTNWQLLHQLQLDGTTAHTTYTQQCIDLPELLFHNGQAQLRWTMSYRASGSYYLDAVCADAGVCTVSPTRLTFRDMPTGCLPTDTPFGVKVCATDAVGFVAQQFQDSIRLGQLPGLSGSLAGVATDGCVRFEQLRQQVAGNFQLTATGGGLSGTAPVQTARTDCPVHTDLRVMAYNLLNFPEGKSCGSSNHNLSGRADTLRKILAYEKPDVLLVCELQTEAGADSVLRKSFAWPGAPAYARAAFVVNQSPGGQRINNMFYYNTEKLQLYQQDEILTDVRDIGVYTVFVNDPQLPNHQDTVFIDFYEAHLKASNTATDRTKRHNECLAIQQYIDQQGGPRNSVLGGDLNLYTASEPAYQALLGGLYPFEDPAAAPGSWDNNAAFSEWHTQATRLPTDTTTNCGIPGGIDSRFDFLLNSQPVMTGSQHVSYVEQSIRVTGNDGQLLDNNILAARGGSTYPDSVLEALFWSSDHLPVVMDLRVDHPSAVLPVRELRFVAEREKMEVDLHWWVVAEPGVSVYEVERSADGEAWAVVGEVFARGRTPGSYFLTDYTAPTAACYYRLRIVDDDGSEAYSRVRRVAAVPRARWRVYPNPSIDGRSWLQAAGLDGRTLRVRISDASGRTVVQKQYEYTGTPLPLPQLLPGWYFVAARSDTGDRFTAPLVVTR